MAVPENPITREEQYLNAIIAGTTANIPEPVTRVEQYLNEIALNGAGGSSGGFNPYIMSASEFENIDTNNYPIGTIFMIWSDSE